MTIENAIEVLQFKAEIGDLETREACEIAIKEMRKAIKKKESKALKPCICGGKEKPHMWYRTGVHEKFFKCPNCELQSPSATTEMQARRNWNSFVAGKVEQKL